jgi:BlaI family transcriptional regulator, penicillinase repressor
MLHLVPVNRMSSQRTASVRAPLTPLESDVMHVVWEKGPSDVEAVHRAVSHTRTLKETTIRTLLRRLEQKGYLRHDVRGRSYVYQAVEPAKTLAARAVRQIIDRFCRGSVEELVSGMVDASVLNSRELTALERLIQARRGAASRTK